MDHKRAYERLQEAWKEQEAASATFRQARGGYAAFQAFSDVVHRRERLMYEAHHCYGEPYKCISCGCSKGRPCVSHTDSARYRNELLEQIARNTAPPDITVG